VLRRARACSSYLSFSRTFRFRTFLPFPFSFPSSLPSAPLPPSYSYSHLMHILSFITLTLFASPPPSLIPPPPPPLLASHSLRLFL
jgi:hypothetical protein